MAHHGVELNRSTSLYSLCSCNDRVRWTADAMGRTHRMYHGAYFFDSPACINEEKRLITDCPFQPRS